MEFRTFCESPFPDNNDKRNQGQGDDVLHVLRCPIGAHTQYI